MKYLLYFFIGVCFCGQILVLSQNGFTKNEIIVILYSNDSVEIGAGDDLGRFGVLLSVAVAVALHKVVVLVTVTV